MEERSRLEVKESEKRQEECSAAMGREGFHII